MKSNFGCPTPSTQPNSLVDFYTGRHVFVDLGLAEKASEVGPGRPDAYLGHLGLAVIFGVEVVAIGAVEPAQQGKVELR